MHKTQFYIFILCSFIFLTLLQSPPFISTASDDCSHTISWTKPSHGTPVDHYVVEADIDNSGFMKFSSHCPDTFYTFTQPQGSIIKIRIAAVDSLDRQGPFSPVSDPFNCP